jgi:hypothetical protein
MPKPNVSARLAVITAFVCLAQAATQANSPFSSVPAYTVDRSLEPPQQALADDISGSRRPLAAVADNVRTLSGVIRRSMFRNSRQFVAGSLRIEPFEGRRPRLRRTRSTLAIRGYGI